MSLSTPSKGSHFSDGVRTGPILGSQFIAGANVLTPSTQVSGPIDQQPPGVFNTPMSLLDFIPAPVSATSVVTTVTPVAAGYLPLNAVNAQGITIVTYQSVANVIKLDVPRNLTFTSAGNTATTITISGWDKYGMPMMENVIGPTANTTFGKKAFMYIKRIYDSVGSGVAYTVGTGNRFGIDHLVTNANYIGIPEWNNTPDLSSTSNLQPVVGPLANNPILTGAIGSSVVTVTVASTAALYNGELVRITGATTTDGITAAQLNITAPITIVDNTHFTYVTNGVATAGATAGGGAGVLYQAVLTTQPYVGPLANNPLTTGAAGSSIVAVTVASTAALYNGELVSITGATTTDGITAAQLNITAPITIVDATHFSYASAGNATAGATAGGGAVVFYQVATTGVGGNFVPGVQAPATATTGDVRGTYSPSSNADGTKRLTINYYSASGDTRNYINAQNGTVILNANPLSNVALSTLINVYAPNHQFTTGENVTISGGVGNVGGITPAQYNLTNTPVTVVDANNFTYNTGIAGTGGTSGGTVVLMSPQFGNLYQNAVGRYGVQQYVLLTSF